MLVELSNGTALRIIDGGTSAILFKMSETGDGTIADLIVDIYDESLSYEVGSYVLYLNKLYKCHSAVLNPEPFDPTKWIQVNLIESKQDTLISGTNIKTVNHESLLGAGDISTNSFVTINYNDLVSLRNNNNLISGTYYRITDYVTKTSQKDTASANHAFDVIVKAISADKLSEEAYAVQHTGDTYFSNNKMEAWKLWYSLDNDTTRFGWADSTNGKGVIYRMIDEFGNDVPYDFKNIKFNLPIFGIETNWGGSAQNHIWYYRKPESDYELNSTKYYAWYSSISTITAYTDILRPTTSSKLYDDSGIEQTGKTIFSVEGPGNTYGGQFFTFNDIMNTDSSLEGYSVNCHSNKISPYHLNGTQFLNTIVFKFTSTPNCYGNIIGLESYNNVFIGSNIYNNNIEMYCTNNEIGTDFKSNTIGSDFTFNHIRSEFEENKIDSNFTHNVTGIGTKGNIIAPYFKDNTLSNYFNFNTISGDCHNNSIGSNFTYNVINSSFAYNTVGAFFSHNVVNSYFRNNSLGASINDEVYIDSCIFDAGIQFILFTSDDTSASWGNKIQNVHVHLGVKGTSTSEPLVVSVKRNLSFELNIYARETTDIIL